VKSLTNLVNSVLNSFINRDRDLLRLREKISFSIKLILLKLIELFIRTQYVVKDCGRSSEISGEVSAAVVEVVVPWGRLENYEIPKGPGQGVARVTISGNRNSKRYEGPLRHEMTTR